MGQVVEVTTDSLCKAGEELCGDCIKVATTAQELIVALSDGLGSGVKANILATLTAEIAATMLKQGTGIEQVVETLADTLPECRVRHLAYATFAVLRVVNGRDAYLVEYDSPPLILVRGGKLLTLPMIERNIRWRVCYSTPTESTSLWVTPSTRSSLLTWCAANRCVRSISRKS